VRRVLIIVTYTLVFWVVLPAGLYGAGHAVDRALGMDRLVPWLRHLGTPLVLAGAWICVHASVLLRTRGKGLPISSLPPTELVTSGPYRYWRHPIYTGYMLLAAGVGLWLDSLGMALVAVPTFTVIWLHTWVRWLEEPVLVERFGGAYRVHRQRTGILLPFDVRELGRALAKILFRLRIRIRVEGAGNVPAAGPLLLTTDHQCYLDFLFGQYITGRRVLIPVTAEVFRAPLQRAFLRMMGAVPKRRFCGDPAASTAIADQFTAGGVVGIAIEGERSWTGEQALPPLSVAHNIGRFDCPIVPVAFVHAYRLWPRWAGAADRSTAVTIRIGEPYRLDDVLDDFTSGDHARAQEIAEVLTARIGALRDPDEAHLDLTRYAGARPQLTLWRCPVCGEEECLEMAGSAALVCARCAARWDLSAGDLTLIEPEDRAGERDSLAGWVARTCDVPELGDRSEPLIAADDAEWREESRAGVTLEPLARVGRGRAELWRDELQWRGPGAERALPLSAIRTVTTERNDTLQLGVDGGVVQVVFERSSPLRWQRYLAALEVR
jgi:1-acyl-sn-glycerol-3-phosphate acyltransferase